MPVETPDTFPALFWAYSSVWLIISIYVWSLGARLRKLERTSELSEKSTESDG